jgi:hypothetical protein
MPVDSCISETQLLSYEQLEYMLVTSNFLKKIVFIWNPCSDRVSNSVLHDAIANGDGAQDDDNIKNFNQEDVQSCSDQRQNVVSSFSAQGTVLNILTLLNCFATTNFK